MAYIANDNFEGDTLAQWWVHFQTGLLVAPPSVGGGFLQMALNARLHTYENEIGAYLGQPILVPATGFGFDVALECQPFDHTFSGLPANDNPHLVGLGWSRPQYNVTGTAAGGGILADDIEDTHIVVGFAPGADNGSAMSVEPKRTWQSQTQPNAGPPRRGWNTYPHPDPVTGRAIVRLRLEDGTLYYSVAEAIGLPGEGPLPQENDYVQIEAYTNLESMGGYGLLGPRLYTNSNSIGGRFYRCFNTGF